MFRRLALIAALMVVVAACQDGGPDQSAAGGAIEGLTVSMISDTDTRSPEEIASARFRICNAFAQLPAGGSMLLTLTIPPGAEPCMGAQSLVTVALAEWKHSPRLGDSPDTVQTPVTGADPCAVLTKLPHAVRGDT